MLRITASDSTQAAKQYYREVLTKGDYYLEGQEIPGHWGGRGAALLGLRGPVKQEDFDRLIDNLKPDASPLTPMTIENRRPCYDFTFDVPKSVSILQAISGDVRLTRAMRKAAHETMRELEKDMHTRVRVGGADHDRRTGNMAWADFTHFTSRPAPEMNGLPGGTPDMHLHMHFVVMNATFDPEEDRWKAGQLGKIKQDAPYWQAIYHTKLAGELQKLGYQIDATAKAFELRGMTREIVEKFSRRTAEIEAKAKALGITDPDQKGRLGQWTRSGKTDTPMATLRQFWQHHLSADEIRQLKHVYRSARDRPGRVERSPEQAARSIHYALSHELERVSEISKRRLLATALQHGIGRTDIAATFQCLRERKDLLSAQLEGETRITTQSVLAEEVRLFHHIREGRGRVPPLIGGSYQFKEPIFHDSTRDTTQQRRAVEFIFQSESRVLGVVGRAGTGKTTLLREIASGLKEHNLNLVVCAPTADASRGVLRGEGFASAETVRKLLMDTTLHRQLKGGVLWVDEAGMLGNRDTLALLELAQREGAARVVLAGDSRQIRSVPRGDAFRYLESQCGLPVVRLDKVQRQSNPQLKEAVEAISNGQIGRGFKALEAHGGLLEMAGKKRHESLAQSYLDKTSERGKGGKTKTALVVSATHQECEAVSEKIRDGLKQRGQVSGEEQTVYRHVNLHLTEAQRSHAGSYEPGLLVEFNQNAPGFKRGEKLLVCAVDPTQETVTARRADGNVAELPLEHAVRLDVYARKQLTLATGDRIRITTNGYADDGKYRLVNGSFHTVQGFTSKGDIALANGKIIPSGFGKINYGYAITADSAQSKTVDAVYAAIGSESMGASDMRRFYVMMSRAREESRVFTDDRAQLLRAVQRDYPRRSATELMRQGHISTEVQIACREVQRETLRTIEDEQRRQRERQQRQMMMEVGRERE